MRLGIRLQHVAHLGGFAPVALAWAVALAVALIGGAPAHAAEIFSPAAAEGLLRELGLDLETALRTEVFEKAAGRALTESEADEILRVLSRPESHLFTHDRIAFTDSESQTPITDQKLTLACYAVTGTASADQESSRVAGRLLKNSARYTLYAKTRGEVFDLILGGKAKPYRGRLTEDGPLETIYYEQGGLVADVHESIRLYGAMPEAAYPGFPRADEAMTRELNGLVAEYAKYAEFERAELDHRITSILNRHLGRPPLDFTLDGVRYDALTYRDRFLPSYKEARYYELTYAPGSHDAPVKLTAFDGQKYDSYRTGSHGKLMTVLEAQLRARRQPVLQYKIVNEAGTHRGDVIGFAAHGLTPPAHASFNWRDPDLLDHYVVALAGEWNAQGHLNRLLIRDTWSLSARAGHGYKWIDADYLFLLEAVEVDQGMLADFHARGVLR